ncbi:hypothetical protein BD779DRAFT_1475301 [Infundibulicybe gibba]|nr:hypothetical protein BD779DRAFT_1475301 [Infundibulicybe gibba]
MAWEGGCPCLVTRGLWGYGPWATYDVVILVSRSSNVNLEDNGSNWLTYKERLIWTLTHQGLEQHLYGTAQKLEELLEVDGKWFNKEEPTKSLSRKEIREHETKIDIFVQQEATQYTFLRIFKEETSAKLWIKLTSFFAPLEANSRSVQTHAEKRAENAVVIAEKEGKNPREAKGRGQEYARIAAARGMLATPNAEPQEEKTTSTNTATSSDTSKDVARAKTSYPREETPAQSTPGSSPRTVDRIPKSRNIHLIDSANKPSEIRLEASNACEASTKNANPSEITANNEDGTTYIESSEYTIQYQCPGSQKSKPETAEGHNTGLDGDSADNRSCRPEKRSVTVEGNTYLDRNNLPQARTAPIEGKNVPNISNTPRPATENETIESPCANRHVLKASRTALERSNNRPKPPENDRATGKSSSKPLSQATKIRSDEPLDVNRRDLEPLGTAIEWSSDQGKPPENGRTMDAPSSRPHRQSTEIRSDKPPDVNRRKPKPYRTAIERSRNQPKPPRNGHTTDSPSSSPNINLPRSQPDSPSSSDYQSDPRSDPESPTRRTFRGKEPPGSSRESTSDTSELGGVNPRDCKRMPDGKGKSEGHSTEGTHLLASVTRVEPRGSAPEESIIDKYILPTYNLKYLHFA